MLILGIDTSGKTAACALFENGGLLGQISICTMKTQSQVILPAVKRLMEDCKKEFTQLDSIAVSKGPGSYTGIRIGLAAVKAMAFALDIPVCGVFSLEALALGCGREGLICSVMKARQDIVYSGIYRVDKKGASVTVMPDRVMNTAELKNELDRYNEGITLTGDGAYDLMSCFPDERFSLTPPHLRMQSGCGVVLAAEGKETADPSELQASYLQLVKAEKDLLEKSAT